MNSREAFALPSEKKRNTSTVPFSPVSAFSISVSSSKSAGSSQTSGGRPSPEKVFSAGNSGSSAVNRRAAGSKATTQVKLLEDALTGYKLDIGSYPDTATGLRALVENVDQNEKWDGPYIKPAVPKDPWGNDYVYTSPGEHGDFDLVSYGADGQPGGTGENADITNYVEK